MMTNKTYDTLKEIPLILEALGTLYFALSQIWSFLPYGTEIVGSITACCAFLSAVLRISKARYDAAENDDEEEGAEG